MVLRQVETATGGDRLQLVVGQTPAEHAAGGTAGAMERVAGICHAVVAECRTQAERKGHR